MLFRRRSGTYDRIIRSIERVREPGERPPSDLFSLDDFVCDLCRNVVGRSRITQCSYCGRWVCRDNCWDAEHLACIACASKIKLSIAGARIDQEAARMAGKPEKKPKVKPGTRVLRRLKKIPAKGGSVK